MKKTLKFLSSVLLVSTLGFVNCHKYESGGSPANGFIVATAINGIVQSATYGNCAISVNGSGLWFGKVVETAITDGMATTTQTPNVFDKADYVAVAGAISDSDWVKLSYNARYDAFFKTSTDGTTWTAAKRNAALAFTRGKMNAVAGLGAIPATCDAYKGKTGFTAFGSGAYGTAATNFGTIVAGWYSKLSTVEQAEVDAFYNITLNASAKPSLLKAAYSNTTLKTNFPNVSTSATTGLPTGIQTSYSGTTLDLTKATANIGVILADLTKAGYIWSFGLPSTQSACSTILTANATTYNTSPFTPVSSAATYTTFVSELAPRIAYINSAYAGATFLTSTAYQTAMGGVIAGYVDSTYTAPTYTAFSSPDLFRLSTAGTTSAAVITALALGGTIAGTTGSNGTIANALTKFGGASQVLNSNAIASCITLDRLFRLAMTPLTKDDVIGTMPTFPSTANDSPTSVPATGTSAGLITVLDPSGALTGIPYFSNKERIAAYNSLGTTSAAGANTAKAQYAMHGLITGGAYGANFYTLGATNLRCPDSNFSVMSNTFPITLAPAGSSTDPSAAGAVLTGANGGTVNSTCSFAAGSTILNCSTVPTPTTFIGATVQCNEADNGAGTVCATAGFTNTTVSGILANGTITVASAPTGNSTGLSLRIGSRAGAVGNNQINVNASYTSGTLFLVLTNLTKENIPAGFAPSYILSKSTFSAATTPATPTGLVTSVSTATSLLGLRSAVGSGALACARIPRANCSYGATTTGDRVGDIGSITKRLGALQETSSCAKPDSNTITALNNSMSYEGNIIAPTSSVSAFTGNKLLPDKAYPKFGKLVDLGFGMIMPVKEGTAAYPDFTTAATVSATTYEITTDATDGNAFTSMGGAGNIGFTVVESCDAIDLANGPFPNAPNAVKKPLTSTPELIYGLGNNGGAASDYDSLRTASYTASGSVTGYWKATTSNTTGAITGIIFSDNSLNAITANGVSIVSAPVQSFGFPTSGYTIATNNSVIPDATSTVAVDTVNFNTSGTLINALAVGTVIPSVRLNSTTAFTGMIASQTPSGTADSAFPTQFTGTNFGVPTAFYSAKFPNNTTVTLTVTSSVSGTAYGTYTGNFQGVNFSSTGGYTNGNVAFTPPTDDQARSCNRALRTATSAEIAGSSAKYLVPAGYKLPDINATSGDGNTSATLAICAYGQATAGDTTATTAFASILTGALGGNSTNAVTVCSDKAKAAAVQFGGMAAK